MISDDERLTNVSDEDEIDGGLDHRPSDSGPMTTEKNEPGKSENVGDDDPSTTQSAIVSTNEDDVKDEHPACLRSGQQIGGAAIDFEDEDEDDESEMDDEADMDEDDESDIDDEDDSASSCSHESPVSDMTISMRMCNSEGYNTSPDVTNNWKSAPEMKMSSRKRIGKRLGPDVLMRADRRDLGVLLDAKKSSFKNGQRTRPTFKKNMTSSFSQTGEHEDGGTNVNDLLISAPKFDQTPDVFGWPKRRGENSTTRAIATAKHRNRANQRIISSSTSALATIDPTRFCHRSMGVQTVPDDEYPNHYYYHTPNFKPHVIDSPLIKCIVPEELPTRKQVVQDSLPEGTLRLVIENFSLMSDTVRGPSKVVHDIPWRIMIMPRQHIVQKKGTTQKCLGFFLQCCPDAYSDSWSCQAAAELKLISQKSGVQNFSRKTNHVYTAKENDWGYSCFMTWADILDETQGYILNDSVILEVHVKADQAKNILSLSEFRKKINEYIRVAQMQCDRGLIDKAIDCNSQAMKFCKDKDPECCRRLQTQHDELVAQKLKQSIARIERGGGDALTVEGDPAANITALRMAMTSNSNRSSAQSRSKRSKDAKSADKRRDLDQMSDRTLTNDAADLGDDQSTKTDTRNSNSSTVTSDKENDSQKESVESQNSTRKPLNSAGELYPTEAHCRTSMTIGHLKELAKHLTRSNNMSEAEQLLKYLSETTGDEEALQIMNEMFMDELLEEDNTAAEKLALPFRFELLARSLICSGGFTFAEIVEKESNALFQTIINQKPFVGVETQQSDGTDAFRDLAKRSMDLADSFLGLGSRGSNEAQTLNPADECRRLILPKSIKKLLLKINSGVQTDLSPVDLTKNRPHGGGGDWLDNDLGVEVLSETGGEMTKEVTKQKKSDAAEVPTGRANAEPTKTETSTTPVSTKSGGGAGDLQSDVEEQKRMCEQLHASLLNPKTILEFAKETNNAYESQKLAEFRAELEALRKEQKTWTKEKNQQLKSQKTVISQLEGTKQECTQMRNTLKSLQKKENELAEELERVRSRFEATKTKLQERETQHSRELQSLNDVKRNYTKELAERQTTLQKLKEQLDDRGNTIKKLEQSVSQEKRNSQKMTERAKSAEIALLDHRMEQAVRNLERTRTDCDAKIEQIEQRLEAGHLSDPEIARLKKDIQTVQKVRDDLNPMIEEARAEGQKHIEQLREGKQLSQLGRISFAKPPTLPALDPLPPIRLPVPSAPIVSLPTQAQMTQPPPSTPEFTPPAAPQPKHFVPPQPPHMPVRTPLNVPPPQHSPAASAFRPLSSGPSISMMTANSGVAVPPNFTSQPPPPFMPPNGSLQHQHMAPYLSSAQASHSELPMFMPNSTVANQLHSSPMPGPIGSRPVSFQTPKAPSVGVSTHPVDPPKLNNGNERVDATTPSTAGARRIGGTMDGMRSLWEDDAVRDVFDNADVNVRGGNANARGTPNTRPADPTSNDIWGGYFSWMLDK